MFKISLLGFYKKREGDTFNIYVQIKHHIVAGKNNNENQYRNKAPKQQC